MSATATPMGFRPVKLTGGRPFNGAVEAAYEIADNYSTSIFCGDPVKMLTTGYIGRDAGTDACTPIGIFLGCSFDDPNSGQRVFKQYYPASTNITTGVIRAYVCDDPDAIFHIQANASVTQAGVGGNAAIVSTAGSVISGNSKVTLGASTINTTSTLPVRIVGFLESPRNAVGDAYTDVLVRWNVGHAFRNTTGI